MSYLNFKSEYDCFPKNKMDDNAFVGYDEIYKELKRKINKDCVLVFDYYPGVYEDEVYSLIQKFKPEISIDMNSIFKDGEKITEQMKYHLTNDRVFGKMYYGDFIDFIDLEKLNDAKKALEKSSGLCVVYGVGASIVTHGDLYVYFDLARWQIQLRYRAGMPNFKADNKDEDILRKYKRGYFIEWRMADKHKQLNFERFDYVVDTNIKNQPKMISGHTFLSSLKALVQKPFRTVPYFDPGIWGGQWMKEVCNLDPSKPNYAWSFDGVPEENSLLFDYQGVIFELPAMDLVLYQPKELLGLQVYSRFGAEFPIRFDFLDTMEGQNLSLQVHPLTEYIKKEFGMSYTQDESYYILDAKEDACVYLGLKDGIDKNQMISDLEQAQSGNLVFDAEKYINKWPAKKHDHFLIPAGTCHCSGRGSMVLEISATPYIFTFKLWDWQRVGLDGKPRPIHLKHGKKNIQWNRTTSWVKENLVNAVYEVDEDCGAKKVEHTGLHQLEFIETRRYMMNSITNHDTQGNVNMLNLIDGKKALIKGDFGSFIVHYAETFIVPACVGQYTIEPYECESIMVIKAYIRSKI